MSPTVLRLEADLNFSSTSADGSAGVTGTVVADGSTIDVSVSGPLVATGRSSRRLVRQVARSLADRRLRLVVRDPQGVFVALGDVRTPWWQRLLTRSPHIRFGSLRRLRQMLRGAGAGGNDVALSASPIPPTLLPLLPTVSTRGTRPVTTTHDPRGGGMPRVVFALSPWPRAGDVERVEYLTRRRTTFGSAQECDVRIEGLEPIHAAIDRTDDDEYRLTHLASAGTSAVAGVPAQGSLLRSGSGITLGATRLTYYRDEYADHGRPYGGRLGGEIGHQRPQRTPRPRASGSAGKPRTNRDPGRYYP